MDNSRKSSALAVAAGAVGMLLLLALIGIGYVYSGAFNVAATEEHTSLVRWAYDTTFHRSIRSRARDMQPPEDLDSRVDRGALEYKAMCEHCHGGPGVERDGFASGMRPKPPRLVEAAAEWEAGEVFWLVKHGARMTGMPAFGPTHDDQTLWDIAAMVKALPAMTPSHYAKLGSDGTSTSSGESHPHEHDDG